MKVLVPAMLAALVIGGGLGAASDTYAADAGARGRVAGARSRATTAHAPVTRFHSSVHTHAFHRGARVGVFVGAPVFASSWWHYPGPYYGYPSYYGYAGYGGYYGYGPHYPPVYQVYEQPTVYIEQQPPVDATPAPPSAPPTPPQQYWYYCQDSKTYYPYVQNCATPWQRVVPHAPQ